MATGYSAESYRTTAYSCDMRWRMIFQRIGMGLPITTIAKNLNIDRSTVSRIVTRFETTGDVEPIKKKGAQSKISVYDEFCIIDSIVEKPSMYLHEIQQKVLETTGTRIDASTVCRFLKNNFSRKKLSLVALQQNAASRAQFLSDISVYEHETGSDRKNSIRRYGYSIVGKPARVHSLLVRGKRFSAIGILSVNGLLDTYVTTENVNADIII